MELGFASPRSGRGDGKCALGPASTRRAGGLGPLRRWEYNRASRPLRQTPRPRAGSTLMPNSFDALATSRAGEYPFRLYRLDALARQPGISLDRLPFSLKVLLENLLRCED